MIVAFLEIPGGAALMASAIFCASVIFAAGCAITMMGIMKTKASNDFVTRDMRTSFVITELVFATRHHDGDSVRARNFEIHDGTAGGKFSKSVVREQAQMRIGSRTRCVVNNSEISAGRIGVGWRPTGDHCCRDHRIDENIVAGAQN